MWGVFISALVIIGFAAGGFIVVKKLEETKPELFKDTQIGISANRLVLGFNLNETNQIDTIVLLTDYKLLTL